MIRPGTGLILSAILLFSSQAGSPAQTNSAPPDFHEVFDLIRQHATGLNDAELNRYAVQGLLTSLGPRVSLITNNPSTNAESMVRPVTKANIFEGDIAYIRIANVGPGLANSVSSSYRQLSGTNKVSGIVLDLRYTDGSDYQEAADTADLFVSKSKPLLDWTGHVVSSREKADAITVPVAMLVNHDTSGASEALAAVLRQTGSGLILGGRTAGDAMITQDFPLKNGDVLRIASSPITLGDGVRLSADGVKPDIDVTVSQQAERAFYANSFLVVQKTNQVGGVSTNLERNTNEGALEHVTFNEAELVREHKAGENPDDDEPVKRPLPEQRVPVVSDPTLARALDLLKGLSVVHEGRS